MESLWQDLLYGALNPNTSGELSNYSWNNHRYNIAIGPDRTAVERDGVVRFEADAGVVVRNYKLSSNRLSFAIKTLRPTKITTSELAGALSLKIDERPTKSVVVDHGNVAFAISAGEHRVAVWK